MRWRRLGRMNRPPPNRSGPPEENMNKCAICEQEQCEREEMCALFWRLDQFWYLDFGERNDEEENPYERYELEFDS